MIVLYFEDMYAVGETLQEACDNWQDENNSRPDLFRVNIVEGKKKKATITLADSVAQIVKGAKK